MGASRGGVAYVDILLLAIGNGESTLKSEKKNIAELQSLVVLVLLHGYTEKGRRVRLYVAFIWELKL